ncbi:uncharacterized protein LOC124312410 [Daphnia pulicaria]|uniref:uncharacterized protein LOC124312410 n=1 Tax=Daphnia pulicaria TaxID=35523 RepID=UPI001EEB6604|nr:uncharacterized protein LOC124312410 [Daphnia pulicaria]
MQKALQGFPRGIRIPMLLFFLLLIVLVCVIYSFHSSSDKVHQLVGQIEKLIETERAEQLLSIKEEQPAEQQEEPQEPAPSAPKYNLMEETYGRNWAKTASDEYLPSSDCTVEYANEKQLQQDHPCVIRLIRDQYLRQPAPRDQPYQLDHPNKKDPSDGQSKDIIKILKNKTEGFFVECGGFDGEFLSNTLFMERYLGWSGLLVEANKKSFDKLISRNRKAFSLPTCLSTKPYPIQVTFDSTLGSGSSIVEKTQKGEAKNAENIYTVQCFPFYSILLAIGRTDVDYFGLDVEGAEYKVLETIPWDKVNIKTLTVEWNHIPEGEPALTRLMESNKFKKSHMISFYYSHEVAYVQDSYAAYL